ncbi:uncharacterized protein METZ01_LOCUS305022 [marine metagenome]|uniref:Uncharacterized protein n=1 Tax=marine metagenome TaxID=408172 RepID=A0A382MUV7_9ZZZZ
MMNLSDWLDEPVSALSHLIIRFSTINRTGSMNFYGLYLGLVSRATLRLS